MKYIIILGDGMADEPVDMLGGLTPLQAARTPYMDKLAKMGRGGMLKTVPDGFAPGSEIAHLSLLGYDVGRVFEGRGSLEAASMGVDVGEGEMAMRCNILTIEDGKIKNHSAGHISTDEARELIEYLQAELGGRDKGDGDLWIDFFPGVSYRHLAKIHHGNKALKCFPPHDFVGEPFRDLMIKATEPEAKATADFLNRVTLRSQELLAKHPVNMKRIAEGKEPANSIWLWSPGYRPAMEKLTDRFGLKSGAVISAVDLIKGIGVYAGLEPIYVDGATGLYDTNYEGKAAAALKALAENDFVFLHIEASDEAGHEGDVELKVKTIEYLDDRIVRPIMEEVAQWGEPVTIALLPDHPTPVETGKHTPTPVPFVIYKPGQEPDAMEAYDEESALDGGYGLLEGDEFIKTFFE